MNALEEVATWTKAECLANRDELYSKYISGVDALRNIAGAGMPMSLLSWTFVPKVLLVQGLLNLLLQL